MPSVLKTPLGYLIVLLFQWATGYYVALFIAPVLLFLYGSCFLLKSFVKDITTDLKLLNVNKTSAKSHGNDKKMEKIFCSIVQCHLDLIQLSCNFIHHIENI